MTLITAANIYIILKLCMFVCAYNRFEVSVGWEAFNEK